MRYTYLTRSDRLVGSLRPMLEARSFAPWFAILLNACSAANRGGEAEPAVPSSGPASTAKERVTFYYVAESVVATQTCEATAPVKRAMDPNVSGINGVLRALFAGPTEQETAGGLLSPFDKTPSDPKAAPFIDFFERAEVGAGVARLYFKKGAMLYLNAAACAQTAVKTSIEKTLRALPGIERIEYFVGGQLVTEWDA